MGLNFPLFLTGISNSSLEPSLNHAIKAVQWLLFLVLVQDLFQQAKPLIFQLLVVLLVLAAPLILDLVQSPNQTVNLKQFLDVN